MAKDLTSQMKEIVDEYTVEVAEALETAVNSVKKQVVRKLKDTSQQEQVRTAIEKRIQTQKTTFEGYGVEQFELLTNNAVIEVRGNFILFIVNADSAEAQKAFLKAI